MDATCAAAGNVEYWHCETCGLNFGNAEGTVFISAIATAQLSHSKVYVSYQAATCTAPGHRAHYHCETCGKNFNAQNEEVSDVNIPALGHNKNHVAYQAATYVTPGNYEYYHCSRCNKNFKYADNLDATEISDITIPVTVPSTETPMTETDTPVSMNLPKTVSIVRGKSFTLASSTAPSSVKVTYSSSNNSVATVSARGMIKAKKVGTAKITVKLGAEKYTVTVKVTRVKTTKLTGVPASKKIAKGKTFTIKAKATPKNTEEKITYKSSNKKVATVSAKGVVRGIRKGTAVITVKSGSKTKKCKVTVK